MYLNYPKIQGSLPCPKSARRCGAGEMGVSMAGTCCLPVDAVGGPTFRAPWQLFGWGSCSFK